MSDYVDEPLPANEVVESDEEVVANANAEVEEPAPVEVEEVEEEEEPAPVEEAPVEEEPVEEDAPVEEASTLEQFSSDIRDILVPVASANEEVEYVITDNMCSLKTLVDVLGKWSANEISRRQVEGLLKEGTEVDENLDDLEKVVEVLQLWIQEGPSTFREHNHFKKLDDYVLSGESKDLSLEKKVNVLKAITELTVKVYNRRVTNEEIQNDMNNLY